jgi:hypothetical protein
LSDFFASSILKGEKGKIMRETDNSYLKKLVARTKNMLTCPAPEQTREYKKAAANSPLQVKITTPLRKADHYAHLAEEKSKKRRIPFVALALVAVFASLCALTLLELRPVALAHNRLALDTTATPPSPETTTLGETINYLEGLSNTVLGYGTSCEQLISDVKDPQTNKPDSFCWDEQDFTWADRDVTCLYNYSHPAGNWWNTNNIQGGNNYAMVDEHGTPLNIAMDAPYLNQNTCTDNSTCVSDNASLNDNNSTALSDQVGGDDILCGNKACLSLVPGQGIGPECGSANGSQRVYDRFACQATSDTTSTLEDANWKQPSAGEVSANWNEDRWWWSTGIYFNPSAYDPNGALYLPTANLRAADIEPSSDTPSCNTSGHWSCPNYSNIIIYQYSGGISQDNTSWDPLKGMYEEVVPNYAPDQFTEEYGMSGGPNATGNGNTVWRSGSAPVPVYWVVCGAQSGWAFPCSDPDSPMNAPFITTGSSQSLTANQINEKEIVKDWLSGNADPSADQYPVTPTSTATPTSASPPPPAEPGHLVYTYLNDTVQQPGLQTLQPYMLGLGLLLLSPILVLIGYQLLWASWTLGRAGAMEAFGRMVLSIMAIVISYQLTAMLIELANTFNLAVVVFHAKLGYPTNATIDGQTYSFTLANQGEQDSASFRGIVIPITRWGCVANDFVALLSNKFWTDAAGFIPFVGGVAKFIGNIFNAIDAAKHIGEFLMLILSIMLCTQVFMRVVLLNYYVLTSPLAFACWGLPGGVGQKVVSSWTKGFLSLLFAQTAQIFVLATFPLILPPFPNLPTDQQFGVLIMIFQALPRILVLAATIRVPTVMGTGASKAIAQAGTVAGGAVAAAGAAAMHTV